AGTLVDGRQRRRTVDLGADAIEIVFANEQYRQLPELGPVEGLVERALVDRTISEEAGGDAVLSPVTRGKGQADRDRELAPDDGVTAHEIQAGVEKVHGAAFAFADAGGLAEKLCHDPPGVGAAYDGLGMFAIGGEDVVILV